MAKNLKLIAIFIIILIIVLLGYFINWRYFELVHLKCFQTEVVTSNKDATDFLNQKTKKTTLFISFDDAFYRVHENDQYKKILEERFIRVENDEFRIYKNTTLKYENPANAYEVKIKNSNYQMDHVWKKPYDPLDLIVKYDCKKLHKRF